MKTSVRLRGVAAMAGAMAAAFLVQAGSAAAAGFEAAGGEPVTLARSVLEDAGAYSLYMHRAGEISPAFANGKSVAGSLRTGAAYEPKQLARGAAAFVAVAALQDEAFVRGVRAAAGGPASREALVAQLISNPYSAVVLPSADVVAARISATLAAEGERVRSTGHDVKMAAYSVQRQAWSKVEVSGRVARLAEAKALSAQPLTAGEEGLALLRAATATETPARVRIGFGDQQVSPLVARGLALAALAVLGEAGEEDTATLQQVATDAECASCLRMSKLNLFQCLAVSKPWYEDVFCLGQHVLIDTGECIYGSSGAPKTALAALAPRREDETH